MLYIVISINKLRNKLKEVIIREIMKKALYPLILLALLSSCVSGPRGELIGVQNRPDWFEENPYGMNYIHFGSYTMGPNDQDVPWSHDTRSKTVTIPAFYIDQHEISNNEYRQFVISVSSMKN